MNSDSDTRSPDIITFPSVIFAVFLIIGLITDRALSDILNISGYPIKFGFSFIILGVILLAWSWLTFATAKTCIDIRKSTKQLVTIGPYKYSRNPMYLGLTLILLAACFYFNSFLGIIIYFPLFVCYITIFQILPEEDALKKLYNEEYMKYCSNVRRWI